MFWPLFLFTALIIAAWLGVLVWLTKGFRRGWLLEEPPRPGPPRTDFRP